jgi:hypothetical protein
MKHGGNLHRYPLLLAGLQQVMFSATGRLFLMVKLPVVMQYYSQQPLQEDTKILSQQLMNF